MHRLRVVIDHVVPIDGFDGRDRQATVTERESPTNLTHRAIVICPGQGVCPEEAGQTVMRRTPRGLPIRGPGLMSARSGDSFHQRLLRVRLLAASAGLGAYHLHASHNSHPRMPSAAVTQAHSNSCFCPYVYPHRRRRTLTVGGGGGHMSRKDVMHRMHHAVVQHLEYLEDKDGM
jgi:hypothetical protein